MVCPDEMKLETFDMVLAFFREFAEGRIEPSRIDWMGKSPDGRAVFKVTGIRRSLGLKHHRPPKSLFDEPQPVIGQPEEDWALVWLPGHYAPPEPENEDDDE